MQFSIRSPWPLLSLLGAAMITPACNGGDDHEEDPGEHACEQIDMDGHAVTATAAIEDAPMIHVSEEPYIVQLEADGTDSYSGFVALHAEEDMDALLFAGTADVVSGLYESGAEVTLAEPAPNEFCEDDIPEHWELELVEGTWEIEFGPSAVDSLWLMVISAEGHAHEHHD